MYYLFQDLLNFEDPLNVEAAEHYERDKVSKTSVRANQNHIKDYWSLRNNGSLLAYEQKQ